MSETATQDQTAANVQPVTLDPTPVETSPPKPTEPAPAEPIGRSPEEYFSFDDHGKTRYADPLAVHRRLLQASAGEDFYQKINSFESQAKGLAYDAAEFLSGIAREAFKLKAFDDETGEGWTEASSIYLLYDFLEWTEKKVRISIRK